MRRAFYYYRDYSARQGASCFWKRSLLMQCHQYQLVCLTPCWGDSQTNACQEHKKLFSSSFLILANFRWAKTPHFIMTFLMVPNTDIEHRWLEKLWYFKEVLMSKWCLNALLRLLAVRGLQRYQSLVFSDDLVAFLFSIEEDENWSTNHYY